MPIWRLLGGAARERIKTYNTCGGPAYGRPTRGDDLYGVRRGGAGKYEDLIAFMTDAGELALDLLSEGIEGMKIWPLDTFVHRPGSWAEWQSVSGAFDPALANFGGGRLDDRDLHQGLEPVRKIREAAGDRMEIMFEGHGFWSLPVAKKIAKALEEYNPVWIEDLMRADDIGAIAELQRSTTIPVLASEYLTTRYEYKPVLEQRAADIIMIDPTWAGGITESKKIATMAEAFKRPVAMHDCTGPFTLYAGIHLAINATNAIYQETVRAYLKITYPEFVTDVVSVVDGHIEAPTAPGLGTALLPDVRTRPDATIVVSELE
jgi:galactonate dehydratase